MPSERAACAFERGDLGRDLLVAALRGAPLAVEPLLDAVEIGHHELELERVEIAGRVGGNAAVVERAQHHEDGVAVAHRSEHFRAQPFTRLETGWEREVHELEAGRHHLLRLRHGCETVEPLVGNGRDPDRGLVLARRRKARERAEQAVRPSTGEAHEPEVLHRGAGYRSDSVQRMSKKTKKRKLKARRNKANHGKRPRAGR